MQQLYPLSRQRNQSARIFTTPAHIWNDPQVKRKMDMIKRAREARDAGVSFVKSAPLMKISPATLYRWDRYRRAGKIKKLIPRSRIPRRVRKTTLSSSAIERFVVLEQSLSGTRRQKGSRNAEARRAYNLVRSSRPARDEVIKSQQDRSGAQLGRKRCFYVKKTAVFASSRPHNVPEISLK